MGKCPDCGREGLSEKELKIHIKYFHTVRIGVKEQPQKFAVGSCPDCGKTLFHMEGCVSCQSCGFSKCG